MASGLPNLSPEQLQQLIQQFQQQYGGQQSGGTAASVPGNQLFNPNMGGQLGMQGAALGNIGQLINGGNNVANGAIGTGVNSGLDILGSIPGPQQPFVDIAAMFAPFIESFIQNGVPRDAKTQSIGGALSSSPNQLQNILGALINKGVNQGNHVLSEGGPRTLGGAVEREASMLEGLTGQQIPGVTGSGQFQHDPTLNFTKLSKAAVAHQLPAGYEFLSGPTNIAQAGTDLSKIIGTQAPVSTKGSAQEWQTLIQQLISQGALQRYKGPLGAPGAGLGSHVGGLASGGGAPTVGLPHPLAPQQPAQGPYPL